MKEHLLNDCWSEWLSLSKTGEGRASLCLNVKDLSAALPGRELEVALIHVQTLRNACAHLGNARQLVSSFGGSVLRRVLTNHNQSKVDGVIVQAVCQLVANCAAHGDIDVCLQLWIDQGCLFRDMVAASAKASSRRAFAATLAAVYNTMCARDGFIDAFCTSRQLLCQILLTLVAPVAAASSTVTRTEDEGEDPAWEWLLRIFNKVGAGGRFSGIFRLLQPRAIDDCVWEDKTVNGHHSSSTALLTSFVLSHEQVILLHTLELALRDRDRDRDTYAAGKWELDTSLADGADLWLLLHDLCSCAAEASKQLQELQQDQDQRTAECEDDNRIKGELVESAQLVLLSVIGTVLGLEVVGPGHALRSSLALGTDILPLCTRLLAPSPSPFPSSASASVSVPATPTPTASGGSTRPTTTATTTTTTTTTTAKSSSSKFVLSRNELMKSALALLGNLCYRCPEAQKSFRISGGFVSVLPRCATRFDNPLEREWALVCVRNACEGCEANQQFVQDLQPQGAKVLGPNAAGVQVEINPSTGTFRFKQNDNDPSASAE